MSGLTNATRAKKALFGRLKAEADGGLLSDVDVNYGYHGNVGLRSIYGGGWRILDQKDAVAEQSGLLVEEIVAVSLYIRVVKRPPVDVEETDAEVDEIAAVLARIFFNDPTLPGDMSWLGIASGQGDYSRTDDETISVHGYQARIGSFLSWRP